MPLDPTETATRVRPLLLGLAALALGSPPVTDELMTRLSDFEGAPRLSRHVQA